jgi:MFS family permease
MTEHLSSTFHRYIENYKGLPKECSYRIIFSLLNNIAGGITVFLSFYFVNNLHIDIATAGTLISVYGIGRALGGYISGHLANKVLLTRISVISLFIETISLFMLIKIHTVMLLTINLLIFGIGTYGFKVSNNLWVLNRCSKKERLKAINILYTTSNLGCGISAVMVSMFGGYGFSYLFCFSGLVMLTAVLSLSLKSHKEYKNKKSFSPINKADNANTSIENKNSNHILIIVVFVALSLMGFIIMQWGTTYNIFLHKVSHLDIIGIGLLYALNPILIVFLQAPLVNALNKYNHILFTGIAAFLMGFGMWMLNFSHWIAFIISACIVYTIGEMIFFSMSQSVCYQHSAEKQRGKVMGLFEMVYALSTTLSPAIGGSIYHYFGGHIIWLLCGIMGSVCLAVLFVFSNLK